MEYRIKRLCGSHQSKLGEMSQDHACGWETVQILVDDDDE